MSFVKTKLQFYMIFLTILIIFVQVVSVPYGKNVCLRTETYVDFVRYVSQMKPVNVTVTKWCWSLSKMFRCNRREVKWIPFTVPQEIKRTRMVAECCKGYKENRTFNSTVCIPVCDINCGSGTCSAPNTCTCPSGLYGVTCEKPCPQELWGENCINECDCLNEASCDRFSGKCNCKPGWLGKRCELPCQEGYYGYSCSEVCDCKLCNHITGECAVTTTNKQETITTTESSFQPSNLTSVSIEETTLTLETTTEMTATDNKYIHSEEIQTTNYILPTTTTFRVTSKEDFYQEKTINTLERGLDSSGSAAFNSDIDDGTEDDVVGSTNELFDEIEVSTVAEVNVTIKRNSWKSFIEKVEEVVDTDTEVDNTNSDSRATLNGESIDHKIVHFIPSLTVLSGVSILMFLMAARWLMVKHQKKTKRRAIEKKENIYHSECRRNSKIDSIFSANNFTENPVYLSDADINDPAPVLQTFKPLDT